MITNLGQYYKVFDLKERYEKLYNVGKVDDAVNLLISTKDIQLIQELKEVYIFLKDGRKLSEREKILFKASEDNSTKDNKKRLSGVERAFVGMRG